MNLEQFAKEAGVKIVSCSADWGGRIGYQTKDAPNCTTCGYRSESAAYKGWLKNEFGEHTALALLKLLDK